MATIFVSHSRYDTDIIHFVNNAFAGSSVKATYMEFENLPAYPGRNIAQRIVNYDTRALFVLMGPNIDRNEYTTNWVAYEVGLAKGMNKPIWLLELFEDNLNNRKNFPIPYVNNLLLYRLGNNVHLRFLRDVVIQRYGRDIIESLVQNIPFRGYPMKCTNEHCKAEYNLFSEVDGFTCPVCRQPVSFRTPKFKK